MPLLVRNNQPGPTCFSDKMSGLELLWEGSGDPGGGDIQQVPDVLAENINFMRVVNRGVLIVEDGNPEVIAKLQLQSQSWADRQAAATEAAQATILERKEDDIIILPCVGPATRGKGTCAKDVPVREKHKDDAPALCSMHSSLVNEFVRSDADFDNTTGKSVIKWSRATTGEPLPDQR